MEMKIFQGHGGIQDIFQNTFIISGYNSQMQIFSIHKIHKFLIMTTIVLSLPVACCLIALWSFSSQNPF